MDLTNALGWLAAESLPPRTRYGERSSVSSEAAITSSCVLRSPQRDEHEPGQGSWPSGQDECEAHPEELVAFTPVILIGELKIDLLLRQVRVGERDLHLTALE